MRAQRFVDSLDVVDHCPAGSVANLGAALLLGITLSQYERDDNWWDNGQDLYSLERLRAEGFELIDGEPRRGDMILMQVRSPVPNHAGVYLGDDLMLHHLYGRLSEKAVYGGMWAERTRYIVRHREARYD